MNEKWGFRIAVLTTFMLGTSGTAFSADKKAEARKHQIEKLIRELDHDEFQVREKATNELIKIGKPAIELLNKQEDSKSAEVRFRVKTILDEMLLERRHAALYILNLAKRKTVRIITVREMPYLGSPSWSPKGNKIAFDAWLVPERLRYAHFYVCNADGSNLKDFGTGAQPHWSPDEKRITFHDYQDRNGIWIMNADGSGRKRIHPTGLSPRWSPDGRYIAFTSGGLHLYDTRSGTVEKPSKPEFKSVMNGLSWSPDGKRISFKSETKPRVLQVVYVHGSGKNFTTTFEGFFGSYTDWSPDGKRIGIASHRRGATLLQLQVYAINVDSKDPPQLLKGQDTARMNIGMIWAPDGKHAAYISNPLSLIINQ